MSFFTLLDKTCSITRATNTRTAYGTTKTYSAHLSGIACRIAQAEAEEMNQPSDGTNAVAATHKAWLPYGTDITERDRLTQGATTYEVLKANADVAGAGHHVQALLLEVR